VKRILTIIVTVLAGLSAWAQTDLQFDLDSIYAGWDDYLDEVVVIGYGERKREYLTGSVAQVSSREILKAPVTNSQQLLTGRLAGLTNIQTTGTPGADGTRMFVRGLSTFNGSEPICVVDGIKHDIGIIRTINPNDIETVSILKDGASTAVYGLDGSNGVIVITTKSGTRAKNKVAYDGSVSFDFNTAMIELMDAQEYIYWNNKVREMDGLPLYWTDENIQKLKDMGLYAETNWLDIIYKPFGLTHQHNISSSGGNDAVQYYSSLGYLSQDGIIRNTNYERYNFRTNLSAKLPAAWTLRLRSTVSTPIATTPVSRLMPRANIRLSPRPSMPPLSSLRNTTATRSESLTEPTPTPRLQASITAVTATRVMPC